MFLPSRVAAALCSSLLLVSSIAPVSAVWPIPKSFSKGDEALYLNQNVEITYNGEPVWWNSSPFPEYPDNLGDDDDDVVGGNKNKGNSGAIEWKTDFLTQKQLVYADGYKARSLESKEIVQAGVSRTMSTIFAEKFVPWMLHPRGKLVEFEPDVYQGQKWVKTFDIVQTGEDKPEAFKPLAGEVDESYNLTVSAEGGAQLTATSSIGVLRGLETFAQLFFQHSTGTFWYTPYAPVEIEDSPEYSHRGVMLDTARSWFPVKDILRTIDAIAWNKMNRLHIHVTDSQSWPLDIPSMPEVSEKGAYAPHARYSPEDVAHIQEYGQHRGVEVYLEIDMPGHIGSVALSHPELIVAYDERPYYWWCAQPPCGAFKMNDTGVDQFLEKLFDDLLPRLEPYSAYFHTGGDELNKNDSMLDPGVGSNETEVLRPLLQKFIDAQHSRVRKHGLTPITWQEIPLEWEIDIGEDVVVHTWLGAESVKNLTSKGHKVFDSNYNFWYLDCGRGQSLNFDNGEAFQTFYPFKDWCDPVKNWRLIYSHDPRANLTEEEAKNVLGGEVAVWSETIDAVTVDSIIWPRASAAGEVLWSGRHDAQGQNRTQMDAAPRLAEWRERMVARGVGAATVYQLWCSMGDATVCEYPIV